MGSRDVPQEEVKALQDELVASMCGLGVVVRGPEGPYSQNLRRYGYQPPEAPFVRIDFVFDWVRSCRSQEQRLADKLQDAIKRARSVRSQLLQAKAKGATKFGVMASVAQALEAIEPICQLILPEEVSGDGK